MAVTLCAAVATGGAALTNPFFWAFAGEISGAVSGATAAAIGGGDVGKGMLIGTVEGGITGGALGPPGSVGGYYVQQGAAVGEVVAPTFAHIAGPALADIAARSIITSGVGAGAAVINDAMLSGAAAGSALGYANRPRFYSRFYSSQYTTSLNAGEIGIGFKKAGLFYHTGLEAKGISGENAIIDFNRAPGANDLDTLRGRNISGKFGSSEDYQFYLVVDNDPTKLNAFFDLATKINNTDHAYNLYGTGNPFNCYKGRDWVLDQLKIKNNVRWPDR